MSQRKLLTNAECLHNVSRLAKAYEKAQLRYDAARVKELFELVQYMLYEDAIILGIDTEVKKLKALIMSALELKYSNTTLMAEVKKWIDSYRAQERAEVEATLLDVARVRGKNITDSLLAGDAIESVWGDDLDWNLVVQGYETNLEDPSAKFFSGETYLLPPAPITTNEHAIDLAKKIRRVCASAPVGKNITLLIPVNQGQVHWQLLSVKLDEKKITKAEVIDSSQSQLLAATLANVQTIVTKVNAGKSKDMSMAFDRAIARNEKVLPDARIISPVLTNVKTDGNKCMHAVAQQVFMRKPARADDVTAQALANATSPLELLTGVVGKIFENRLNVAASAKDTAVKLNVEEAKAKVTADVGAAAAAQAQVEAKAKAKAEELAKEAASIKAQEEAAAKARAEEKAIAEAKAQAEEQARKLAAEKLAAEEAAKLKAQTEAVAKLKDTVRNIFTTEVNSEAIHKKLSAEENREIQIDFDHSLALELSQGDCDSADYFRASWKSAYSGILNKYGLFTVGESKKAAEQLFTVDDATTKKTVK